MVDFRPFRGIRYNAQVAGDMADLVCPPYDVISAAQEQALLAKNPHNMVQLELSELSGPAPADRYTKAAEAFKRLRAAGVLRQDEAPAYYLLRQRFSVGERSYDRYAIFGALRIEEFGGSVLPHEDTAAGPKEDRLALMEVTEANFSPVMMLYRDPTGQVRQVRDATVRQQPVADFTVGREHYTYWMITDGAAVAAVRRALADQPGYVADGHHRYETSIVYRDRKNDADPDAAHRFVMTCLIDFDDPGLLILPYYRVVHSLSARQLEDLRGLLDRYFASQPAGVPDGAAAQLDDVVSTAGQGRVALGLVEPGKAPVLLTPADDTIPSPDPKDAPERQLRAIEAWVLQEMLFKPVAGEKFPDHVAYVHDGQEAMDMVASGGGQMAFFIKGVPADIFEAVVGAGIRMPRKTTYFYPKLPSGLAINPLTGTT